MHPSIPNPRRLARLAPTPARTHRREKITLDAFPIRSPSSARRATPHHPNPERRSIRPIGGATFHAERIHSIPYTRDVGERASADHSGWMVSKNIRAFMHSRRVASMVRTCALQALAALPQAIVFGFGRVVLWRIFYKVSPLMESSGSCTSASLAYNARSMSLSLADSAAAMMSVGAMESSFSASSE